MPDSLHGSAPDSSETALLLIDVINGLEFPEAENLLEHALPMARRLRELKRQAKCLGIPAIYVNDNFGRWKSDFRRQVEHCLRDGVAGRSLVELLAPEEEDYFVLKPKHSGFYSTPLEILLAHLGVKRLVITGIATNICVLFTANDAYMRGYDLVIPEDCVAANSAQASRAALEQMAGILKADVRLSSKLRLERSTSADR